MGAYSASQRLIELVTVRVSEDENVDVANGPLPRLPLVPGCPGPVYAGGRDAFDRPEDRARTAGTPKALVRTSARPG